MKTVLRIEHISKQFRGLQAVKDFNAKIYQGEIVGLIGPNGAGKTTVFNIVSGFLPQDEGRVFWFDRQLDGLKPNSRAKNGLVRTFQHTHVFRNLTVYQNILIGTHLKTRDSDIHKQCKSIIEKLGLVPVQDLVARELPYGYSRKLNIGVALAADPTLLLLDEPAAGLNTSETMVFREILKRLCNDGLTMWVIEHNMSFVMGICNRIIVLSAGQIIAEGTPDEIRKNHEVQAAYLGIFKEGDSDA